MKLSSKARYAVMAMTDLANQSINDVVAVSLNKIAERQHLPLPYLEQLFLSLKKAGLVLSTRGSQGGYQLAKLPQDIYIQDIILAVDQNLKATRCEHKSQGCQPHGAKCMTHDLWDELTIVMETFLSKITLQHVITNSVKGVGRYGFMSHEGRP